MGGIVGGDGDLSRCRGEEKGKIVALMLPIYEQGVTTRGEGK